MSEAKKKLKSLYLKIRKKESTLNCGISLANYISRDLVSWKLEFNKIADNLSKIDPLCPKFRYKI